MQHYSEDTVRTQVTSNFTVLYSTVHCNNRNVAYSTEQRAAQQYCTVEQKSRATRHIPEKEREFKCGHESKRGSLAKDEQARWWKKKARGKWQSGYRRHTDANI